MIVIPDIECDEYRVYILENTPIGIDKQLKGYSPDKFRMISVPIKTKLVNTFKIDKPLYKITTKKGKELFIPEITILIVEIDRKTKVLFVSDLEKFLSDGKTIKLVDDDEITSIEKVSNESKFKLLEVIDNPVNVREYLIVCSYKNLLIKVSPIESLSIYLISESIGQGITEILPGILELEFEKVYDYIFIQTKKRYYGYKNILKFDVKGLEIVRRDWNYASKQLQRTVMDILAQYNLEKGKRLVETVVRDVIKKYKSRKFNIDDVIITKKVKSITEYKDPDRVAQAQIIRLLERKGFIVPDGTIVSYVVLTIPAKIFDKKQDNPNIVVREFKKKELKMKDRVYPIELVKDIDLLKEHLDIDYVLEKQILPPTLRLLEVIGINQVIFKDTNNTKITDFIRVKKNNKKLDERIKSKKVIQL